MERYLIISYHTEENCKKVIGYFSEHYGGFINNFEWGCFDGDHSAYAIIEAENKDHALMSVPAAFRKDVKVVQLNQFSREQIKELTGH